MNQYPYELVVWNPEIVCGLLGDFRDKYPDFDSSIQFDLTNYFHVRFLEIKTLSCASTNIKLTAKEDATDILQAFVNETYSDIHYKILERKDYVKEA